MIQLKLDCHNLCVVCGVLLESLVVTLDAVPDLLLILFSRGRHCT